MALFTPRVKVWVVMLGLITAQFGTVALFLEYNVLQYLTEAVTTDAQQVGVIIGLVFLSVTFARYGYYRYETRSLQVVGVILMLAAYGFAGQFALETFIVIDDLQFFIELLALGAVFYFTILYWYASWSSAEFYAWDAKAVIILMAVGLLAVAGVYAPPLLLAAFIVAFIPMLMHFFHQIMVLNQVNLKPFRHGMRLYIAIFGFWVELILFLLRATKRIFL